MYIRTQYRRDIDICISACACVIVTHKPLPLSEHHSYTFMLTVRLNVAKWHKKLCKIIWRATLTSGPDHYKNACYGLAFLFKISHNHLHVYYKFYQHFQSYTFPLTVISEHVLFHTLQIIIILVLHVSFATI